MVKLIDQKNNYVLWRDKNEKEKENKKMGNPYYLLFRNNYRICSTINTLK